MLRRGALGPQREGLRRVRPKRGSRPQQKGASSRPKCGSPSEWGRWAPPACKRRPFSSMPAEWQSTERQETNSPGHNIKIQKICHRFL